MAKRARGSHHPGQRRPISRTAPRPAPTTAPPATSPRPSSLTAEEEARAAELEAQIVAEERSAENARQRSTDRRRAGPATIDAGPRSTLGVSAEQEYAYVGRDVRRIATIGGGLIILLVVLAIVSHVSGAGPI